MKRNKHPLFDIEKAKKALLKIELEESYHKFVQYAFYKIHGKKFITKEFHLELINLMERIHDGYSPESIANVPPRYGKTLICVVLFVAWSFAKNPKCNFIHLSFSDSLVLNNSREIRDIVTSDWFQELWDIKIRKDVNSKNEWATEQGGMFYVAPMAGQVTGRGAGVSDPSDDQEEVYEWLKKFEDIKKEVGEKGIFQGAILIDDPTKPDEGTSITKMNNTNDRLNNTVLSRRNSPANTPILIIMQRISEMDMTSFCIDGNTGENWNRLSIPVLGVKNGVEYSIWPEKHSVEKLKLMKKADPKTFSGQYMQEPTPLEGEMFKRENWKIVDSSPNGTSVRGYDLAATKRNTSAFTASCKITKVGKDFYIENVQNDRLLPHEVESNMVLNAQLDGNRTKIDFPNDPGQAGNFQTEYLISKLVGYIVTASPETGSKEQRAMALASQQAIGNVYIVKGDWNKEFIEQATSFPNGKFKDMIDAASRAFHSVLEFGGVEFDDIELNDNNIDTTGEVDNAFF